MCDLVVEIENIHCWTLEQVLYSTLISTGLNQENLPVILAASGDR